MLPEQVHENQKQALMEATVKAVVLGGFENLTTKEIGNLSGVKEIYIYRYFDNKEDLVEKTFSYADKSFLRVITENLAILDFEGLDLEMRCRVLFQKCWDYILSHPDWLIFYVRYYYSLAFQTYSYKEHIKRFDSIAERLTCFGFDSADSKTVMHHLFDTLLGQAQKQIINPKDPALAAENAFWLLFSVINGKGEI